MSGSFIAVALITVVLIVFWRVTLVALVAVLVATMVTGAGFITDGITSAEYIANSVSAPADHPQPPLHTTPPR